MMKLALDKKNVTLAHGYNITIYNILQTLHFAACEGGFFVVGSILNLDE